VRRFTIEMSPHEWPESLLIRDLMPGNVLPGTYGDG